MALLVLSNVYASKSLQGHVELLAKLLTAFATKVQGLQACCTLCLKLLTLLPPNTIVMINFGYLDSMLDLDSPLTVPKFAAAGLVQLQQQSLWYLQGHLELQGLPHSPPSSSSPLPQQLQ
jgi:hypothetical protein